MSPAPHIPPAMRGVHPTSATEQETAQLREDMREDAKYLAELQSRYCHPFLDTNAWWSTEDTDAA